MKNTITKQSNHSSSKTIIFSSGPATLTEPCDITKLNEAKNNGDHDIVTIYDENNNRKTYMIGNFDDFRVYMLALYDRFEIVPDSIKILDKCHFSAKIRSIKKNNVQEITFTFPYNDISLENIELTIGSFSGHWNDGFIFKYNGHEEKIICDIKFLATYGKNVLDPIRLDIQYIGIAKSKDRLAQDRLGDGHEKLQKILAELLDTPDKKCAIILYKFKEDLEAKIDNFQNTLEIIEASLIKHFQPIMNSQRKHFPKDSKKLVESIKKYKIKSIIQLLDEPDNCIIRSAIIANSNHNDPRYREIKNEFIMRYAMEHIKLEPKHIVHIEI